MIDWITRILVRVFFLLDRDEVLIRLDDDPQPVWYERTTVISAPAPRFAILLFVLSIPWYCFWIQVGVFGFGGSWDARIVLAALPVSINSAIRGSLKFRERVAMLAKWDEPVGRERIGVRLSAMMVGALLGFAAGYILFQWTWFSSKMPYPVFGSAAVGLAEAIRNGIRIGGKFKSPDFDIEDFRYYKRLDEPLEMQDV